MIQHNVGVSAISGLKALEDIKISKVIPKSEKSKISKSVCDSIVMTAKVMDDLSIMRRHLIKPYLNKKIASMASQRSYDKMLFGSDLAKSLREAEDYSKATKDLGKNYAQTNYNPSYRPYIQRVASIRGFNRGAYGGIYSGYYGNTRPFLARGRSQYRRGPQREYVPQYNYQAKSNKKKE